MAHTFFFVLMTCVIVLFVAFLLLHFASFFNLSIFSWNFIRFFFYQIEFPFSYRLYMRIMCICFKNCRRRKKKIYTQCTMHNNKCINPFHVLLCVLQYIELVWAQRNSPKQHVLQCLASDIIACTFIIICLHLCP